MRVFLSASGDEALAVVRCILCARVLLFTEDPSETLGFRVTRGSAGNRLSESRTHCKIRSKTWTTLNLGLRIIDWLQYVVGKHSGSLPNYASIWRVGEHKRRGAGSSAPDSSKPADGCGTVTVCSNGLALVCSGFLVVSWWSPCRPLMVVVILAVVGRPVLAVVGVVVAMVVMVFFAVWGIYL